MVVMGCCKSQSFWIKKSKCLKHYTQILFAWCKFFFFFFFLQCVRHTMTISSAAQLKEFSRYCCYRGSLSTNVCVHPWSSSGCKRGLWNWYWSGCLAKELVSYNPFTTIIWCDGQDVQKQYQIFSLSISTLTEERLEVWRLSRKSAHSSQEWMTLTFVTVRSRQCVGLHPHI